MYRPVALCAFILASMVSLALPAHVLRAAPHTGDRNGVATADANWETRDTAVYIVSTLNLLRTRAGKPVVEVFERRDDVSKYVVLDDRRSQYLYFIELQRADGSVFGAYAFRMGWARPLAVTRSVSRFGVRLATPAVIAAYRSDPTVTLMAFPSPVPR